LVEPSKDKPFKAFIFISEWNELYDIPDNWKEVLRKALSGYIN